MFNNKVDSEADFCEAYKSQVLNNDSDEEESSFFSTMLKILTILLLLSTIIVVSIFGYKYFISNNSENVSVAPPISAQTLDEELIVTAEDEAEVVEPIQPIKKIVKNEEIEEKSPPLSIQKRESISDLDLDGIAASIKLELSEIEEEESTIKTIVKEEEEISKEEEQYIEELAGLSEEIDKDIEKREK